MNKKIQRGSQLNPTTQPSFFDQEGIYEIGPLSGASGALQILSLHHGAFQIKAYNPNKPYTLISEWLCADIATEIGLEIPAREIISYQQQQWLGLEWRNNSVIFSDQLTQKIINPEIIPGMIAFDILVCNRDRHAGNILLQRYNPRLDRLTCHVIDHSHALIGDLGDFNAMITWKENNPDPDAYVRRIPELLRGLITDIDQFEPWLERIENLSPESLESSLNAVPTSWKPSSDDSPQLIDFIESRKTNIRDLVSAAPHLLPGMST